MIKLAILGGSTPFITAFFDSLYQSTLTARAFDVWIHGRNMEVAQLVTLYATNLFMGTQWVFHCTKDYEEALRDAPIVVHQVRYGGLERRAADEQLCNRIGVHADETLGPAALCNAIRIRDDIKRTAELLIRFCDQATVINLTNPLSITTQLLCSAGLKTIGVCELPRTTLHKMELLCGCCATHWEYIGLNHRGFLYNVRHDNMDMVLELCNRRNIHSFEGVPLSEVQRLGAVPTKYYSLILSHTPTPTSRATALMDLRSRAIEQLRFCSTRPPEAVKLRLQDWYDQAVQPLIQALLAENPVNLVLNLASENMVQEISARASQNGIHPIPRSTPPMTLHQILSAYTDHERAVLAAVCQPNRDSIEAALRSDPSIPTELVANAIRETRAHLRIN